MGVIKRMDHVAVIAKDMDESIKFYTEILGFKFLSCITIEQQAIKSAMLDCGGESLFEIVQFLDDRPYDFVDGHYELVGFTVDDLDEAIAELKGKGVEFLMDEPVRMGEKDGFIFFRGPSGEKLEIVHNSGEAND